MRQGERVKDPKGTKQKSGRKFAIRPTPIRKERGRSECFPGDCLTKTQVRANS